MQNIKVKLMVLCAAISSHTASAYTAGLEIHPIATLLSIVPGVTSVSGAGELSISPHVAISVGGGLLKVDMQELLEYNGDSSAANTSLVFHKVDGRSLTPELKYYFSGTQDSFYLSAGTNIAMISTTFEMNHDQYELHSQMVSPRGEIGYRWLWDSGFQMRFGINYSQIVRGESSARRISDEHELSDTEVKDILNDDDLEEHHLLSRSTSINVAMGFVF